MIIHRIGLIATTVIFLVGVWLAYHHTQAVREQWSDAAVDLWLIPSMEEAIEGHWVKSDTGTILNSAVEALRSTLAMHQQVISPEHDWIGSLQVDYIGDHQLTAKRMSREIDRRIVIEGEDVRLGLSMAIPDGLSLTTILVFLSSYAALIAIWLKLWPKPYTEFEAALINNGVAAEILRECGLLVASHGGELDKEVFVEARNVNLSQEEACSISLNAKNAGLYRQLRSLTWSSSEAARYVLDGGPELAEEEARWFRFVSDEQGMPHQQALEAARKHTFIEFDRSNCCVILGGLEVKMGPLPMALYELIAEHRKKTAPAVIRPSDDVPDKELGVRLAGIYQQYKGFRESTLVKLQEDGLEANQLNQKITSANKAIAKIVSNNDFYKRYFAITTLDIQGRSMYVAGEAESMLE